MATTNEPDDAVRTEIEQRLIEACRFMVHRKAAPNTASALKEVIVMARRIEAMGVLDGDPTTSA